ncbi:ammonium transporter [Pseudodesulfovibrio sp. zrk46]|uniref:ammonium transporter n=1 Tax=Pseudodesulfovibrio sp. zrk46 TaxID=2725288 RepID=UPI001449AC7F|nr:ammonium transporter [Pseudodesulfovibrio sp. zrk46]QJB55208.1 ammonium transporter [Pseudodesulfovibrio sp. zrk46]
MFLRKSPTPVSRKTAIAVGAMVAVLAPSLAFAEEVELMTQFHGNVLWTLVAAILVFLMQAGFGCVEAGFTRAKSAGNIMMKNFLDFSAGSVIFFLFGFGVMFGVDASGFIGTSGFGLAGVAEGDLSWTYTFWFFQSVFAATAATIVSGGMAERTKFGSYIIVSIVLTGLIYPISGHWAWGSLWLGDDGAGWLEGLGFCDFAGSSVVHSVGGWIALAGAMVLGPRIGKYTEDGKAKAIPGHNIPLAGLGVFILWFGWFGFNPGSTTTADGSIGFIAMNTSLAACGGVLGAMVISWFRFGKPDISMTMNGALAGLVGITAGCATVSPGGSIIIGLIAGLLVVLSIEFIDKVLKIDDPVGASSVHGVCGAWGTLACGLFNTDGGLFYGGGVGLLGVQLIGVGVFFVWAFGTGYILMSVVKAIFGIRVKKDEELKGLDIAEHGSESYNGFQLFSNE